MSKCVVCEAMIGSLQGLSSDKHAIQIFHHELYLACTKLPRKFYQVCINLVYQLAPQIEVISRTIPPSFICSHLKVCDNYFEILDSNGCIEGPQFWCTSTVNAATCGTSAIEYCQQYVWKGQKPKSSLLLKKMLIAP